MVPEVVFGYCSMILCKRDIYGLLEITFPAFIVSKDFRDKMDFLIISHIFTHEEMPMKDGVYKNLQRDSQELSERRGLAKLRIPPTEI